MTYQNKSFLNLIYIKLAGDRRIKIVPLNRAGVKFQSILEILEIYVIFLKKCQTGFFSGVSKISKID